MADPVRLEKAELRELKPGTAEELPGGKRVTVQFNPETLKVSYANQLVTPEGGGGSDRSGTPARQFVGAGTTKLALQLWFDATAPLPEGVPATDDVRKLTEGVAYFITPKAEGTQFIPPGLRFLWGSFQFDGLVDSLEETLEFFSPEGRPLRAGVALNLSQQKISAFAFRDARAAQGASPPGRGGGLGFGASVSAGFSAGTRPLTPAPAGIGLPALADAAGLGDRWQEIAARNGIENPRLLPTGRLLDLGG